MKNELNNSGSILEEIEHMNENEKDSLIKSIIESTEKTDQNILETDNLINIEKDYNSLLNYRKNLIEHIDLTNIQDNKKYLEKIQEFIKEIEPEPLSGILISIILYNGTRIFRKFEIKSEFSLIYKWCSIQDLFFKDKIKLGQFILLDFNGLEINPKNFIYEISKEKLLLFVKLLF